MRIAALAISFAAIVLIVLPGCPDDDDPGDPFDLPGLPTLGKNFNCTKICRDANGNVVSNNQRQIQAETQADAEASMAAYGTCLEGATEQVACQPAN